MDDQTTQPVNTQQASYQPTTQPSGSSKGRVKPLLFSLLAVILLAVVGYGVYSWQHGKVNDANTKVSSLQSQVSGLQSQVNKLSKEISQSTSSTSTQSSRSSTQATYATLSPATVPSKAATCTQALTTAQDGTVGPLTCSNGDLNSTAWQYIAGHYAPEPPSVMTLGYNATCQQVLTAMGNDSNSGKTTKPSEEEAETISAQYYGWNFATNPDTAYANQETSC
jgi:outer membrane murein-binding lipoprotein Lpp